MGENCFGKNGQDQPEGHHTLRENWGETPPVLCFFLVDVADWWGEGGWRVMEAQFGRKRLRDCDSTGVAGIS